MQNALAKTYLVLALGCGAIMAFVDPPFQSPDEPNHFFRAMAMSRGYWLARRDGPFVGAPMPANVIQWVFALYGDLPGHPDKRQSLAFVRAQLDAEPGGAMTFADFRNTALYSPIGYVPQAAGLAIGRWMGLPMLVSLYLARLANLAVCVVVCHWACRKLPYGQLTLILVLLSPMFLFQVASLSGDAAAYALAIAFTAHVLRVAHGRSRTALGRREIAALCALGSLMSLTKPSIAAVPLLGLLLVRRRADAGERAWREAAIVIGVCWIAMLGWSLAVRDLYVPAHPLVAVDPRAQFDHVLADPVRFLAVLWNTVALNWQFYYRSAVGILGWLDTQLRPGYIDGFFVALLVSGAIAEPGIAHATWRERAMAVLVIAATYVLLACVMYLTWTAVAGDVIEGVQGRYFLPLATLATALLQWPSSLQARVPATLRLAVTTGCLVYAVFLLGHAFTTMAARYWL